MRFINKCYVTVLLLFAMFFPSMAKAVDPYEFQIYGYATQGKGNFSPQLLNSFVAHGRPEGEGGTSPNTVRLVWICRSLSQWWRFRFEHTSDAVNALSSRILMIMRSIGRVSSFNLTWRTLIEGAHGAQP